MRKSHYKVSIRVDFEGEDAEKVEYLRKIRGLKSNSELVRQLIIQTALRELEAVKQEKAPAWEISPDDRDLHPALSGQRLQLPNQ